MTEKKVEVGSDADKTLGQIVSNIALVNNTTSESITEVDAIRHSIALGRFITEEIANNHEVFVEDGSGKMVPVDIVLS